MTNFTNAATYRATRLDTASELVPTHPVFKSLPGEELVFDPQRRVTYSQVMYSIQQNFVTSFDIKVLTLIATFGSACVTTLCLKTLLKMHGEDLGAQDRRLEKALQHLAYNNLISLARFQAPDKSASLTKVIFLTGYGSKLIRGMGYYHRFNQLEIVTAAMAKSRAQTSMLITQFLKHLDAVESFEVRPVFVCKEKHPDAIVRPAALIRLYGEDIYFEVPRSGNESSYLEDLSDKLHRYTLCFESHPSVVINGEDVEMNRQIFTYLCDHRDEHGFNLDNILFTHDIAQFGSEFATCLYSFDGDGNRICFEFATANNAA